MNAAVPGESQRAVTEDRPSCETLGSLTIDVEEWFHILDCGAAAPALEQWPTLESRVEASVSQILDLLAQSGVKATFFWLAWVAERHPALVRRCLDEGHEVASHGYAHLLAYQVGPQRFREDIVRAKACLEDITGEVITGFRSPGFGVKEKTAWAFDVIRDAGYLYDASVFPSRRGHGGMPHAPLAPYRIMTRSGPLFEVPTSVVKVLGWRLGLFGGGYLRLAPQALIKWGVGRLDAERRPLVAYIHPREIDTDQPRLPLPLTRRFKSYVNLHTTLAKVEWLCRNRRLGTMRSVCEAWAARTAPDEA